MVNNPEDNPNKFYHNQREPEESIEKSVADVVIDKVLEGVSFDCLTFLENSKTGKTVF